MCTFSKSVQQIRPGTVDVHLLIVSVCELCNLCFLFLNQKFEIANLLRLTQILVAFALQTFGQNVRLHDLSEYEPVLEQQFALKIPETAHQRHEREHR